VTAGTGVAGGTTGPVGNSSFLSEPEGMTGKGGSTDVTEDNPGGRLGGGGMTGSGIYVSHVKNELYIKRRRKKRGCQGGGKNNPTLLRQGFGGQANTTNPINPKNE
jgi:hypothetical protein